MTLEWSKAVKIGKALSRQRKAIGAVCELIHSRDSEKELEAFRALQVVLDELAALANLLEDEVVPP